MIYPSDFESRIGFDSVRADIAARVQTDGAGRFLAQIEFSSNYQYILEQLRQTSQMLLILYSGRAFGLDFPTKGYIDISAILPKARAIGGFMEPAEMVKLGSAIELFAALNAFFNQNDIAGDFGDLRKLIAFDGGYDNIASEIARIVDRFGAVRDGASAELASIRRQLSERSSQISKRLQQILHKAQLDGYADPEASVNIRDGRAVIPISAGNKRKVKGFVFDESASGRTAYIEPLEVIELNNEVRELQNNERREIIRVLTQFADFLRPYIDELIAAGDTMCYFDFLIAKAHYANSIGGVMPIFDNSAQLYLRRARHPLLEKNFRAEGRGDALVPLDIGLTEQKHILLISGPNAGGKSVCLKTVGLLQYMLQCGLLVPTLENSEMGVFDSIFLDIGDQQSIDDDLSTYSSHLSNMKMVLKEATPCSLVLIDEFGGGTEPNVGGAIAEAILEQIADRGTFGVITTHYANLKYFAAAHNGIENGAMTFDVQKIQPLYKLEMGHAGSSFAFEIAHKIGLPQSVLNGARERIGEDKLSLEKQLREAVRDKRYWEAKRDKIRLTNKGVDQIAEQYESELAEIKKSRSALIRQAKEEAAAIVGNANALIENTIREIRESQADKERTRAVRGEVEQFKAQLIAPDAVDIDIERKMKQLGERERRRAERSERRAKEKVAKEQKPVTPKVLPLAVGATVKLSTGMTAEVLSINGNKATVAMGALSSVVDVGKLTVIAPSKVKQAAVRTNVSQNILATAMEFVNEIDIRGMRVVEGVEAVREFIDRAIVVGQHRVRILHGKGTGALKVEVRNYLKTEPMVSHIADEKEEFGGAGITVVDF